MIRHAWMEGPGVHREEFEDIGLRINAVKDRLKQRLNPDAKTQPIARRCIGDVRTDVITNQSYLRKDDRITPSRERFGALNEIKSVLRERVITNDSAASYEDAQTLESMRLVKQRLQSMNCMQKTKESVFEGLEHRARTRPGEGGLQGQNKFESLSDIKRRLRERVFTHEPSKVSCNNLDQCYGREPQTQPDISCWIASTLDEMQEMPSRTLNLEHVPEPDFPAPCELFRDEHQKSKAASRSYSEGLWPGAEQIRKQVPAENYCRPEMEMPLPNVNVQLESVFSPRPLCDGELCPSSHNLDGQKADQNNSQATQDSDVYQCALHCGFRTSTFDLAATHALSNCPLRPRLLVTEHGHKSEPGGLKLHCAGSSVLSASLPLQADANNRADEGSDSKQLEIKTFLPGLGPRLGPSLQDSIDQNSRGAQKPSQLQGSDNADSEWAGQLQLIDTFLARQREHSVALLPLPTGESFDLLSVPEEE